MNPPQVISYEDDQNPWPHHEPLMVSVKSVEGEKLPGYPCAGGEDLLRCEMLECDADAIKSFKKQMDEEDSPDGDDGLVSSTFMREGTLKPLIATVPQCKVHTKADQVQSRMSASPPPTRSTSAKSKKNHRAARRQSFPAMGSEIVRSLGTTYVLTKWDVLCGRGRGNFDHIGNKRLRVLVSCYLQRYADATTRLEKSNVIDLIVDQVLDAVGNVGGSGFVKRAENGEWFELSKSLAREKVGHQLRDLARLQSKTRNRPTKRHSAKF